MTRAPERALERAVVRAAGMVCAALPSVSLKYPTCIWVNAEGTKELRRLQRAYAALSRAKRRK